VLLGGQTLLHALRGDRGGAGADGAASRTRRLRPSAALRQGLLNDLGNPKIAVFFTTLLPQFAPAHGSAFATLLAFGLVFCAMTFAWLCAYSVAVAARATCCAARACAGPGRRHGRGARGGRGAGGGRAPVARPRPRVLGRARLGAQSVRLS
jgi:threonine/homoserine/homoserine lactone efflux protein